MSTREMESQRVTQEENALQSGEVSRCLECGAAVEAFDLTCEHCHAQIKRKQKAVSA